MTLLSSLRGRIFLASALLVGHGAASAERRHWFYPVLFSAMLATTVFVIVDIEYPRLGLIDTAPGALHAQLAWFRRLGPAGRVLRADAGVDAPRRPRAAPGAARVHRGPCRGTGDGLGAGPEAGVGTSRSSDSRSSSR